MRFLSLHLTNFRSYAAASVALPREPGCTVFLGENGAGKTNVLEALSILSLTQSCRGRDDRELIRWGESFFRIRAEVGADDGTQQSVEVVREDAPRRRKAFFVNDVRVPAAAFLGGVPTVTFLPQDLTLFTGPPAARRRFLDQLLSQVSREYHSALSSYQQVLQQRNALLKSLSHGRGESGALELWDYELARFAACITRMRLELVETLHMTFEQEVVSLGEAWTDVQLFYDRKTAARDDDALAEEMRCLLASGRERDIAVQATVIGPHRDDWGVRVAGRDLPTFASRGQERTAVLALVFLQVSYLQLRRGETPVLLLDDAASELDDAHQERLLCGFPGAQVLLTALRLPPHAQPVGVFRVRPGAVTEESTVPVSLSTPKRARAKASAASSG